MSDRSIFDLPARADVNVKAMFEPGDALIIIRQNGEIVPMSIGIDVEKVSAINSKAPDDLTEEEQNILQQGNYLFLLTMAAKSSLIMSILASVANQPGGVSIESLKKAVTLH